MNTLTKFRQRKSLYLLIVILFISFDNYSQKVNLPDSANFYDYLNYYFNSDAYNPTDTSEGGERATHERLINNWGSRLYPHGEFSVANKALINYAKNYASINSETEQVNWINIGPSNGPVNSTKNGVGQIHRISFDPQYGIGNNKTVYACSGYGGLWRSENDGDLWQNVNTDKLPLTSVADIAIDPDNRNNLIIGTGLPDGGINLEYSSNWGYTNPIFTLGLYRSMDYGGSWQPINSGFMDAFYENGGTIRKLEINPFNGDTIFAATSRGIFKCQNAFTGTPIWTKVLDTGINSNTIDFRCIKYKPNSLSTLYASSDNIYRTDNGGETWIPLTGPGTTLNLNIIGGHVFNVYRINLAVTKANPNKLFALVFGYEPYSESEKYYIFVYDGNQWTELYHALGDNTIDMNWIGLAVSPLDENLFFFYGTHDGAYTTGVNGYSYQWNLVVPYSNYFSTNGMYGDVHVLEFQPNITENPKLFSGHHAGVSVGDISVRNKWEFKNNNLSNMLIWSFDNSEFLNNTILTGNQDCFSYLKKDNQWTRIPGIGGDSYTARSSKNNEQLFYVTTNDKEDDDLMQYDILNNIIKTEGKKIIPKDLLNPVELTKITKTFPLVSFINDNYDYFGFSEIYKRLFSFSTPEMEPEDLWEGDSDLGKTESQTWARQVTELDYCLNIPNVIYLATGVNFKPPSGSNRPYLFKAENGGTNGNFQNASYASLDYPGINNEDFPIISGIAVHPNNPDSVWITMIGYDNIDIRVALSIDGGETWQNADPLNSLPELPVNGIVYQNGSNDILYIATDAGIYYKNASMDHWEELGDFPHVRVHELKIDYCSNKLRAATYGRSVWETDLLPGSVDKEFYVIKATENLIWDKPKSLKSSIRIKDGGTLTIKDLVNMPKDSKIIVEQGGKLVIEGGILTNECGNTWKGIEVWGNNREHQWPDINDHYAQGRIILKDATIKNAICAINFCNPEDPNSTGGIVLATNTNFINNTKSVQILKYKNFHPVTHEEMDYQATFKYCNFELNTEYISPEMFYMHADLTSVRGVRFDACDFSLAEKTPNVSEYNIGLAAYSANFSVNPVCDNVQPPCPEGSYDSCSFTGFYNGISASLTGEGFMGFFVNRANFVNNVHGVNVNGIQNYVVLKSNFEIGENNCDSIICSAPFGFGIYSSRAYGFTIEENHFKRAKDVNSSYLTGIYIDKSNFNDAVYKNTFIGLRYGNYASLDNILNNEQFNGLTYLCNHNTNNYADFFTPERSEVDVFQGDRAISAGNTFSHTATWHFYNDGLYDLDYYYCSGCANEVPNTMKLNRVWAKSSPVNSCPSHYTGEIKLTQEQKAVLETEFVQAEVDYNIVNCLYSQLEDGGNTDAKVTEVNNAIQEEMQTVKQNLLATSPHLSEPVLKAVSDKTEVFPDAAVFDILSANPDEMKNETLIKHLEEKENPLPQYMIDILKQVSEGSTYKSVLQQDMAMHARKKSNAAMDQIRGILNDTILNHDELRNWLNNLGGIDADMQIIETYMQQRNYDAANALADTLPSKYSLEGNAMEEFEMYISLLNLEQLLDTVRSYKDLTETEYVLLQSIADSSIGKAGAKAKGIITKYFGGHFYDCIPIDEDLFKSSPVNPNNLGEAYGLSINCNPNPAKEWTAIDYTLPKNESTGTVRFFNNMGKLVFENVISGNQGQFVWDARKVDAGQYSFILQCGGFTKSGKIIIIK